MLGEHPATIRGDQDDMLQAYTAHVRYIDAGLEGDDHASLQHGFVVGYDARLFVVRSSYPVSRMVRVGLVSCPANRISQHLIEIAGAKPGRTLSTPVCSAS
jgi:hypothetical protein